jgi:TolB-like protein
LRAAGLEVWFDKNELRGGDAWDASIRKQIKECAVFIPIISASTQKREEGYFRLEWKLAIDRSYLMAEDKAFFFPAVIDDTPERLARVPEKFRELQWTTLSDEQSIEAFAERIKSSLSGAEQAVRNSSTTLRAQPRAQRQAATGDATSFTDAGFWVAVPAFKCHGVNSDLEALAEGFAEDIVTGLSRFSYLRVMARDATSGFASESGDVRVAANEPKARYIMAGSLRHSGAAIRVSVQLVDTSTGANLWAEHYDRPFSPESVFELQDELIPRIVSTVADMNGVLPRSLNEAVRNRAPEQLNPYEAVLRSFGYFWRLTPEEFNAARAGLELAVQKAPAYADAWAMLALLCVQAHGHQFDPEVDFLSIGESAARKAVDVGPSNHMAHFSLAQAFFFKKEFESFRNAALKAAALNPMDGNTIAFLGELLAYSNELAKGAEFAANAKQLNPHHPGWYWFTDFYLAYREGEYRQAVSAGLKVNLPEHWGYHFMLAAAYGQLGETTAAGNALQEVLQIRPDFATTVRADLARWFDPEYAAHLVDGLKKAGLELD